MVAILAHHARGVLPAQPAGGAPGRSVRAAGDPRHLADRGRAAAAREPRRRCRRGAQATRGPSAWPWAAERRRSRSSSAPALSRDFYDRLDRSSMVERVGKPFERAGQIAAQMRREWNLDTWAERDDTSELITLARYVNACTAPTDRVLVQGYLPQVLALAQRAFAGGHADLRPGFFAHRRGTAFDARPAQGAVGADHPARHRPVVRELPQLVPASDGAYRPASTGWRARASSTAASASTCSCERTVTPGGVHGSRFGWPCYGSEGVDVSQWPRRPSGKKPSA